MREASLPGERGTRSDAVQSRRRILASARALFAEKGVDRVSTHEVGRSAGVGQGTLYRHFAHKGEMCRALLGERIEEFAEETRARLEEPAAGSELESLGWFVGRVVEFNEENAPLLGAIRDASGGERRVEMRRNPFYEWLRGTAAALLVRAISTGEARSDLDVEWTADALLAPLDIDLYLYQRHELGMMRERIAGSLSDLLLRGVAAETSGEELP